jgi:protein-tyrosine phosphatase
MMLRKPFNTPPLPNTYWVIPGQLLGGEYPTAETEKETLARLEALIGAGVNCFVNLTRPGEMPAYRTQLRADIWYFDLPIVDHGLPADRAHMRQIQATLAKALDSGRCVYVHCRMGIGRTGTVLGCRLVEQGLSGEAALDELNRAWRQCARAQRWATIPETREQRQFVATWEPAPNRTPATAG